MLNNYRLVVLGSGGVGKTSLVDRFVNDNFPSCYNPTIEDIHRHLVQLPDGAFHGIEILDTAGLHQFPAMRDVSIKSGNAFVLVYAIDNKESFNYVLHLVDLIKQLKGTNNIPMVLVGNKLDQSQSRVVSEPDAYEAALNRTAAYVETSAKNKTNVQDVFMALIIKTLIPSEPRDMTRRNSRRLSRRASIRLRRSSSSSDRSCSSSVPIHTGAPDSAKCVIL